MAEADPLAGCLGGGVFQQGQAVGNVVKFDGVEKGCRECANDHLVCGSMDGRGQETYCHSHWRGSEHFGSK